LNPDPESDPELITDPDPNLEIISVPDPDAQHWVDIGCWCIVTSNGLRHHRCVVGVVDPVG
jgi:hypothetical protein